MTTIPAMPSDYPDAVERLLAATPDMLIAEAYWQAAHTVRPEPGAPTGIRRTQRGDRWVVRWQQNSKEHQATFDFADDATRLEAWLQGGAPASFLAWLDEQDAEAAR